MLHKSEDEVVKVGQSYTQEETSAGSDSKTSHNSEKGHKEREQKEQQMYVRESWEDDSIIDGEEEKIKEGVAIKRRNEGINNGSDGENEETITHTDSMVDENYREYEPTSTDSEESAVSVREKKTTKKKQTTITNTLHLTKQDLKSMTQKKGIKEIEVNERQIRSMRTIKK